MILLSQITKNQFILSTLQEKHDLVKVALMHTQSYQGLQRENVIDSDLQTEALHPSIKRLRSLLYQFPYVSVTWLLLTDLTADADSADPSQRPARCVFTPLSTFEISQLRQTLHQNFTDMSISMLDSVGQAEECIQLCKQKQRAVDQENSQRGQLIEDRKQ